LGILVTLAGFGYDLTFAGIPYQDPTPEMAARFRFHSRVARAIEFGGLAVLLLGILGISTVALWSALHLERRLTRSSQRTR
jgi:hypothetical protein